MTDFRGKTCGECAWAGKPLDAPLAGKSYCRKNPWCAIVHLHDDGNVDTMFVGIVHNDTPACPAFVPMEKPVVPEQEKQAPCPKCGRRSGIRWTVNLVSTGQVQAVECFDLCGHRSRAFHNPEDALADFYKPIKEEPDHDAP